MYEKAIELAANLKFLCDGFITEIQRKLTPSPASFLSRSRPAPVVDEDKRRFYEFQIGRLQSLNTIFTLVLTTERLSTQKERAFENLLSETTLKLNQIKKEIEGFIKAEFVEKEKDHFGPHVEMIYPFSKIQTVLEATLGYSNGPKCN